MAVVRRYTASDEPRMEMTPLLDVIFLLLTFFIYSLVVMVQANILPVKLPALSTAEKATDQKVAGITVDQHNRIFFNREPVTGDQLREKLRALAAAKERPAVYVALEAQTAGADRGPTLIGLIDTLRGAGIEDFFIVGQKDPPGGAPAKGPSP